MMRIHGRISEALCALLIAVIATSTGCKSTNNRNDPSFGMERLPAVYDQMPRELSKVVLPEYVIEPPDIVTIEGIHIVPKPPYRLKTLDVLNIQVEGTLQEYPIFGTYAVEPGGLINLGVRYGSVQVVGMTSEEAEKEVTAHLQKYLSEPVVAVSLAQMAASQQILGEFLVQPDGTITLGTYGSVSLVGLTTAEGKQAVEDHLSKFLDRPEISMNVQAFNSKKYYIVLQGAGLGDAVYKLPVTGNETVLDAIADIQGLEQVSSKKIWVARPTSDKCRVQIMPVDWYAITELASPETNYQVMPGDRIFIAEDKLIAFDTHIAKLTAPLERIMGFTLLGTGTATRLSGKVLQGGGNPNNNGI